MKQGIEGNARKRLFYFFFEHSPYLIGLTVADLEAWECAFHGWCKEVHGSIENSENVPGSNLLYWPGERIAACHSFFGLDYRASSQSLEDFLEIILGQMLGLSDSMNRERFLGLSEGKDGSEAIICFLGDFHIASLQNTLSLSKGTLNLIKFWLDRAFFFLKQDSFAVGKKSPFAKKSGFKLRQI